MSQSSAGCALWLLSSAWGAADEQDTSRARRRSEVGSPRIPRLSTVTLTGAGTALNATGTMASRMTVIFFEHHMNSTMRTQAHRLRLITQTFSTPGTGTPSSSCKAGGHDEESQARVASASRTAHQAQDRPPIFRLSRDVRSSPLVRASTTGSTPATV